MRHQLEVAFEEGLQISVAGAKLRERPLEHDGHVLLVRRPAKGLLGGMLALPTDSEGAPAPAEWREAGSVDHVFTHFALTMTLKCARVAEPPEGTWWPVERIGEAGLPTLFAKLAARGAAWREAA